MTVYTIRHCAYNSNFLSVCFLFLKHSAAQSIHFRNNLTIHHSFSQPLTTFLCGYSNLLFSSSNLTVTATSELRPWGGAALCMGSTVGRLLGTFSKQLHTTRDKVVRNSAHILDQLCQNRVQNSSCRTVLFYLDTFGVVIVNFTPSRIICNRKSYIRF